MSRHSVADQRTRPAHASRRRFIFAGVAGIAALATVRLLQPVPTRAAATLSADGAAVMRALLPAFLDRALPADPNERQAALDEALKGVETAIDGLPPIAQGELAALFTLLAFVPIRVAVAGVDSPWHSASVEAVNAFLNRLRTSRWSQKRAAYDALHQLAFAAHYANPRSWPAIGYPGPPRIR